MGLKVKQPPNAATFLIASTQCIYLWSFEMDISPLDWTYSQGKIGIPVVLHLASLVREV